jgi:hypothetical protein
MKTTVKVAGLFQLQETYYLQARDLVALPSVSEDVVAKGLKKD